MQSYEEFVYSCVLSDQSFILCVDCICHQSVHVCLYFYVVLGFFFWKPSLYYIGPKVMEKKIFKNIKANFHSFLTNSPMKWTCPFIWNLNWKSLIPKDGYTTFVWHWPKGSGEDFLKHSTISVFSIFPNYLPFDQNLTLLFN